MVIFMDSEFHLSCFSIPWSRFSLSKDSSSAKDSDNKNNTVEIVSTIIIN